jgi:hypothetical protein
MEIIKFAGNNCLIGDKILIDTKHSLIISKLKNCKMENFIFNDDDKLWYYKNYKSTKKLIEILYPELKNKDISLINNTPNDYTEKNIKINSINEYIETFPDPVGYTILEYGTPYYIKEGRYANQYRNMYWKVSDNESIYYLIHIKENTFTKISCCDLDKVFNINDTRLCWYVQQNGYVSTTTNANNRKVYYLHQLIMGVHEEDLTNFEKTVDHISHDKLDNRRENLRLTTMSEQNRNRDKMSRRCDACLLPEGFNSCLKILCNLIFNSILLFSLNIHNKIIYLKIYYFIIS